MFRDELAAVFTMDSIAGQDVESHDRFTRLASVIDNEGGQTLRTPRDVIRAINALRLYAGPVSNHIDLADMTWLQLIRIRNPELYDWVESYINNVAAISDGASILKGNKEKMMSELIKLLAKEGGDVESRLWDFKRILPGLDKLFNTENSNSDWTLYHNIHNKMLSESIRDKRLGSPEHFRFYFALAKPSGAIDDLEFKEFINKAENDPDAAIRIFQDLAKSPRPQGGVRIDPLLSRLEGKGIGSVSVDSIHGILLSLSAGMDTAARVAGPGDWGRYWNWPTAIIVFEAGLKRLKPHERLPLLQRMFSDGAALGWLAQILREETFSHERFGTREKPVAERILSPEEYDIISDIMHKRFTATPPSVLMQTPNFLSLLFAWQQSKADGESETREWVANQTKSDHGLLQFLENCRSFRAVNDKVIYQLSSKNLRHFLDFNEIRDRIEKLKHSNDPSVFADATRLFEVMIDDD